MTDFPIPDAALDTHIGVLGRTGTGKTYTARGLVERLLDAKRQVVIIDPTGAWWGLRSLYPIPIFGGEHGDVPITDASGDAVAQTILSHHSSAIIDLSQLARESHAAMRRFMTSLIGRLKDRDRGALWLVVDEADEFMPQVLPPDMTRLFGDLRWIVRRGRIAGWRVMMITQRPQDIAKSVLTQIGTLVAHRLTAPQDRKAIEEWVKGHADEGEARQVLQSLASLGTGEAWAWSPDHGLLVRAMMPAIKTFDSGATPDADSGTIEQPPLTAIDLGPIRATLEAKGEAPGMQHSQNATDAATDNIRLSDYAISDLLDHIDQRDPNWVRHYTDYSEIEQQRDKWKAKAEHLDQCITNAVRALGYRDIEEIGRDIDDERERAAMKPAKVAVTAPQSRETPALPALESRDSAPTSARTTDIPPRWGRILDAIAWTQRLLKRDAVDRNIVAWFAGCSPKSSGFQNDLGAMRTRALICYPGSGLLALDNEGKGIANWPTTPPTKEALFEAIKARLEPRFCRILDVLWSVAPGIMTREKLAERLSVSPASSGFQNDLGKLRTLGLVDYPVPGQVELGRVLR